MCYEPTARPPYPPVSGGSGSGRQLTLRSGDGTDFLAFSATSDRPTQSGVVILPDVRGLHPFYEELALRLAEAGSHATAIDYFGRTAGAHSRSDDFDFMTHVAQTRPETLSLDIKAAADHLRSEEGGSAEKIITIGFCFGGRLSFNQAAGEALGLSGVIGFYGRVGERESGDPQAPVSLASTYRCPVLGLFGGADAAIPTDDVDMFRKSLEVAGIENEIVSYEGAPHSFFDRAFDRYVRECDDAWRRILRFIAKNAG